jgi:PKD repeat protein
MLTSAPSYLFDFGTGGSVVASGYQRVSGGLYTANAGFGWSDSVSTKDGGAKADNPLLPDNNYMSATRTFSIQLPNGTYSVTPVLGDTTRDLDGIEIWLEGVRVDSQVNVKKNESSQKTYQTTVNDGKLDLRLTDTAGVSFIAIAGLTVFAADTMTATAGAATTANEGSVVAFAGSVTGGVAPYTYAWNFGDGGTASGSLTPSRTYADNGIYTATLTVTDSGGRSATATRVVTVNNVAPTANAGGPYSGAAGASIVLTGSATDPSSVDTAAGFTFAWNFGDGTTGTGAKPSHVYASAGNYTVTLTATDKDGGKSAAASTTVYIMTVSAGSSVTANEGSAVAFAGSVTGGVAPYTYTWNFGDGSSVTGASTQSHSYLDNGSYSAVFTVVDAAGRIASAGRAVTINNVVPTANANGPYAGEAGASIAFHATATDPSPVDQAAGFTYSWNFGDGTTGSGSDPVHVYNSLGSYTATVTATDKDGGTSVTALAAVVITAAISSSDYTLSGPASGEVARSVTLTIALAPTIMPTGTVRFTPSTSNGDGTFSPAFVDLTKTTRSATITYTPNLWGVRTISISDNGNLKDPVGLNFVSKVQVGTSGMAPAGNRTPDLGGFNFFEKGGWWQELGRKVITDTVAPNSADLISKFGTSKLKVDWSSSTEKGGYSMYGIPFTVVPGDQPLLPITVTGYPGESDKGPVPFFPGMAIEWWYDPAGKPPTVDQMWADNHDHHALVLVRDEATGGISKIYEYYQVASEDGGLTWICAAAGAEWDMKTGEPRWEEDTSSDAAGLPIVPLQVRYDEAARGQINHPLRVAISAGLTLNRYVWPARHHAYNGSSKTGLPMGARLRLNKAWYDANASSFSPTMRAIVDALRNYGAIVADLTDGGGIWLTGVSDERWNNSDLAQLSTIPDSAFEVLDTIKSPITFTGPATGKVGMEGTFTVEHTIAANTEFKSDVYIYWSLDNGSTWQRTDFSPDFWFTISPTSRKGTVRFKPKVAGTYLLKADPDSDWIDPPMLTFTVTN